MPVLPECLCYTATVNSACATFPEKQIPHPRLMACATRRKNHTLCMNRKGCGTQNLSPLSRPAPPALSYSIPPRVKVQTTEGKPLTVTVAATPWSSNP
jgi:hypothetical protein